MSDPTVKEIEQEIANQTSEIVVILDRSGSMGSIKTEMESGLNAFIADQKAEPGVCVLTLVQFDGYVNGIDLEWAHEATLIADVGRITIEPRGGTPLLDAVGFAIKRVSDRHRTLDENDRPGKVLVLIVTDGEENASREYKKEQIQALVKERTENAKWAFMYLGANVDAFHEAGCLGVPAASTSGYSGQMAGQALSLASKKVSMFRSAGSYNLAVSSLGYTDEERTSIGGETEPDDDPAGAS